MWSRDRRHIFVRAVCDVGGPGGPSAKDNNNTIRTVNPYSTKKKKKSTRTKNETNKSCVNDTFRPDGDDDVGPLAVKYTRRKVYIIIEQQDCPCVIYCNTKSTENRKKQTEK